MKTYNLQPFLQFPWDPRGAKVEEACHSDARRYPQGCQKGSRNQQKSLLQAWQIIVFIGFLAVFWSKKRKLGHFFVNQRLIKIGI